MISHVVVTVVPKVRTYNNSYLRVFPSIQCTALYRKQRKKIVMYPIIIIIVNIEDVNVYRWDLLFSFNLFRQ